MQAKKALVSLFYCLGLPKPSLLDNLISNRISYSGSIVCSIIFKGPIIIYIVVWGMLNRVAHYTLIINTISVYSKTCVKRPLSKRTQIGFQDQLSLNAGQKYCRMLQGEHSVILSTFIKLPFVI